MTIKITPTSIHTITYEYVNDKGEVDTAVVTLGLGSDNKLYSWSTVTGVWELYVIKTS